ncbi:hypothetical protein LZ554_001601 [Drepanopeziza brunnea f. sp. 'monogermtubi']|nr:hypothetical protein LZ554_001601 [Drepanopeziza brunnea f. sp. 'monogermtubi']
MATIEKIHGDPPFYRSPLGPMVLGEAPIYRHSNSTLHWVDPLKDIPELHILKVDPQSGDAIGTARVLQLEESVSVQYFRKGIGGSYICAYYAGVAFMDEETVKLEILNEIIPLEERGSRRFNDGGVDAKGRFWLAEIDKTACAFGLGKLPECYGAPKGRLWRRLLVDYAGTGGEPDGMVVDSDGNLWIAVYGSNRVMVFNPSGKQIKELIFSAQRLTCPTWGGENNKILFITSARDGCGVDGKPDEGGNMFRYIKEGTKGKAENEFAR